jgi:Flp pilus assembly protein CpaB
MEMEFKDPGRRRRMLTIVVGALLALGAGWGAYTIATNGNAANAEVIREPVLVAARDIPARTTVTIDDVTVREVPIDELLSQSYRESGQVLGRVTAVPVYADQQVTPNLFATTTADADFSILSPDEVITATSPYWRAVAVSVPPDRAVGGEIKAGDHVDLFVSVEIEVLQQDEEGNYVQVDTASEDGLIGGKSTKITYQDLEVLKINEDEQMYIMKVDLHQAEEIAHIIQVAPDSFALALRPAEDTRRANPLEYGETTDRLIMSYLFPAPQLIDLSQLLGLPVAPGASPIPGGVPTPTGSPDPAATPDPNASPDPNGSPEASPEASPTP